MAFLKRTQSTSRALRAHAEHSAQIDDYVASQIEAGGPRLSRNLSDMQQRHVRENVSEEEMWVKGVAIELLPMLSTT